MDDRSGGSRSEDSCPEDIRRRITAIMDEMLKLTKDLHRMKINPHQPSDREVAALVKRITEKAYGGA